VDHLYNPEANQATSSASLSSAPGICTPAPTAQEIAETHPWTRGCGACWWTDQASSGPAPQSKPCTWPAGRTAGIMPVLAPPPPALSLARHAYPGHRASTSDLSRRCTLPTLALQASWMEQKLPASPHHRYWPRNPHLRAHPGAWKLAQQRSTTPTSP
jgi:hypothetical protein